MTTTAQQPEQEKRNNNKLHALYLTIIVLLAGGCVYLSLQLQSVKTLVSTREVTINQVVAQNDDIQAELADLKEDFDNLQTNDERLNKELDQKRKMIDSLMDQAEKHKNDAFIISKLRKETKTLRTIMQGYVRTIDSLNTLNGVLVAEKNQVLNKLDEEKANRQKVEGEKQQLQGRIEKAMILSTGNIWAVGIKSARGGKKDSEQKKASKVDRIRVTFELTDNDLAKAGPKDIFIRVITPDGKELTKSQDRDHMFEFNGNSGFYAAKKTVDYQNQPMNVVMYCDKAKQDDVFLPGKYIIEINCDKTTIGSTTLVLE